MGTGKERRPRGRKRTLPTLCDPTLSLASVLLLSQDLRVTETATLLLTVSPPTHTSVDKTACLKSFDGSCGRRLPRPSHAAPGGGAGKPASFQGAV